MITPSFDQTLIARAATGLYNLQIGSATTDWALEWVNGGNGTVADLVNQLYVRDFAAMSDADVAAMVVANVNITEPPLVVADATLYVAQRLGQVALEQKGAMILAVLQEFSLLADDPIYGSYATAFNAQISAAVAYAQIDGTVDVPLDQPESMEGKDFRLSPVEVPGANGTTLDIMRLAGDQAVRIDLTANDNQVRGLDLDGNGTIENNGVENNDPTTKDDGYDFEIVDAYMRDRVNESATNNFLGNINYDGTGFAGDGVNTNGNIFLGGLGADTALGGIGNDFMAGGGVASGNGGGDTLFGGRNADFFFAELSLLDNTDGNQLVINGGSTSDDAAVGNNTPQDADWLLIEVSDDEDGTVIDLGDPELDGRDENFQTVVTGAGRSMTMTEVEHVDASGNLYGFLDNVDVAIGGNGQVVDGENVGIGASAQLHIIGSLANNILIGGYDNDLIEGDEGSDLLMGGNLRYAQNNPNGEGIVNDGADELIGGDGDDNLVWEADGGIYEGENTQDAASGSDDTLWLTHQALGTRGLALIDDGVLRFDLATGGGSGVNGGLAASAGYGGADANAAASSSAFAGTWTADQTNYGDGVRRTQVQDMESIIATGLGGVDYKAAGSNDPDLLFNNQQNHFAYDGNLDLRGTSGVNTLYASVGDDVIEGRQGGTLSFDNEGNVISDNRDKLSGGAGSDDFIFALAVNTGDGVDVIHRQTDLDVDGDGVVDNLTDGTFGVDFGEEGPITASDSSLTISLPTNATALVDGIQFILGGETYRVEGLASDTFGEFNDALNDALDANPELVVLNAVLNADNTITITDPSGRIFEKDPAGGWVLKDGVLPPDGTSSWSQTVGDPDTEQDRDVLIYASYEDRADGELVDDDSTTGSAISLGVDSYAEDLVVDFSADGTRIAEDQSYVLTFTNLTTEDTVTVTVNGLNYKLTVGVDLDGNEIAGEELVTQGGTAADQAAIQTAFLARLAGFVNTFMDDDTAAGDVAAAATATTITLTQVDYDLEETVFMRTPTVDITNASGGEAASVTVLNNSQHEVHLLGFNGRNGELDKTNVLFIGNQGQDASRAVLETGKGAAGTANVMSSSEAVVIDGGTNTLQATVFGGSQEIANNTATNSFLRTDFTVHGDDLLISGVANDTVNAGTGDDRVLGSLGTDVIDGGRSYYAVKVLGESLARVYVLNEWEASHVTQVQALQGLTISSVNRIGDSESGNATPVSTGTTEVYRDTLQFQQADFVAGTNFTVTLAGAGYAGTTAAGVQFTQGGSGSVAVDQPGTNLDGATTFTNFENIRTISGTGNAVADDGQGNDTLNVTFLSGLTGGVGVSYDLTDDVGGTSTAGDVRISRNADTADGGGDAAGNLFPDENDYEQLVIKVDGVENVVAGVGNDLLMIDETEAAKDNSFNAGLGNDRIQYLNSFDSGDVAEPIVTITLDNIAAVTTATTGVDVVSMTGGRVGTTVAADSLTAVERIALGGNTAEGMQEADLLDVTAMAAGAIVDYVNEQVRDLGGVIHVRIEGMTEIENVWADGNDTVMVADNMANAREDSIQVPPTPSDAIEFMTFLDYDDLTSTGTRQAFGADATDIMRVINQGQYTFELSKTGTGADSDTVDYKAETGNIVAVANFDADADTQYVLVDTNGNGGEFDDGDFDDSAARVDALIGVENIVAAQEESVLDLTGANQDVKITFSSNYDRVANYNAAYAPGNGLEVHQIAVTGVTVGAPELVEMNFLDYVFVDTTPTNPAGDPPLMTSVYWNRIEGSKFSETVELSGYQADEAHTLNLRGGNNRVNYEGDRVEIVIDVVDPVAGQAASTGLVRVEATHSAPLDQHDGNQADDPIASGTDIITSYSQQNTIEKGSLTIKGARFDDDSIAFDPDLDRSKLFVLGGVVDATSAITVTIGSGTDANSLQLVGFEILVDSVTNDVYDIADLDNVIDDLDLEDNGVNDRDTVIVSDDAAQDDGGVDDDAIELAFLEDEVTDIGSFDFDILDLTLLTDDDFIVIGDAADTEVQEVIVGDFNTIDSDAGTGISFFDILSLNDDATGSSFDLDITAGELQSSAGVRFFDFDGNALDASRMTRGVTVTVNDTAPVGASVVGSAQADNITGGAGDDVLIGGGGNDTLAGGSAAEVRAFQLALPLDGLANTITVDFNAGQTLTLTEVIGAPLDNDASDGTLDISAGSTVDAVGARLEQLISANLAAINAIPNLFEDGASNDVGIASVDYDEASDTIRITFVSGSDVDDADVITFADTDAQMLAGDAGTDAAVESNGGTGGADIFVLAASASANGVDTINGWDASDALSALAFFGAPASFAGTFSTASGGAVNVNDEFAVFDNNGTSLTATSLAAEFAAGQAFSLANGETAVIVEYDAFDADTNEEDVSVWYVSRSAPATGTGTLTATRVATLAGADEVGFSSANISNLGSNLSLIGTSGADTLSGTFAADQIFGLGGDDFLFGGDGADLIEGGDGSDNIFGGKGSDFITGGAGADALDGSFDFDADTFNFVDLGFNDGPSDFSTIDTIANFVSGSDRLQFAEYFGFQLGTVAGNYVENLTAAVDLPTLGAAAALAHAGGAEYYFGVVGANGYLIADDTADGWGTVVQLTGVTDMAPADIVVG